MHVTVKGPFLGQAHICEPILRALPEWFGIEAATVQYIEDTDTLPTLIATVGGTPVGFLTYREHNPFAAEVHVIGVRPEYHRRGIGRALLFEAERVLRGCGIEFLQVKTLSPSHPDVHYARTRLFYEAMGFRPLEEFPELWGAENPCVQMIKSLSYVLDRLLP